MTRPTNTRPTASTINDAQLDALYDRLARARDAADLHRRGLISAAELHAVIEARPAATEPAHCPCNGVHFPSPENCRWCKCHRPPARSAHVPGPVNADDCPGCVADTLKRAEDAEQRVEQLAATLREVLDCNHNVSQQDVARWRAVLDQNQEPTP